MISRQITNRYETKHKTKPYILEIKHYIMGRRKYLLYRNWFYFERNWTKNSKPKICFSLVDPDPLLDPSMPPFLITC